MSGKGSAPRPLSVSNEEYASRWDAIFGKVPTENDLAQQALGTGAKCPPCHHDCNEGRTCPAREAA